MEMEKQMRNRGLKRLKRTYDSYRKVLPDGSVSCHDVFIFWNQGCRVNLDLSRGYVLSYPLLMSGD